MSFESLVYDTCAYNKYLQEATGPGNYQINTPKVDCKKNCFYPSPYIRLDKTGVAECASKSLIDVDSELMLLNYPATKCPTEKYFPKEYCKNKELTMCEDTFLQPEDTRISNRPCTLRGTGWNRWEWLCLDPQSFAVEPYNRDVQTRVIVKDNHRPCVPKPLDQTLALPKASDECYTDGTIEKFYNEKETTPFVHWRCCGEIAQY